MQLSLQMRKALILLNLGKFEEFGRLKRGLGELFSKAEQMARDDQSQTEAKEGDKGAKLRPISLEKLTRIRERVDSDMEKIRIRMQNRRKKEEADTMLRSKTTLDRVESEYSQILANDPGNMKGE